MKRFLLLAGLLSPVLIGQSMYFMGLNGSGAPATVATALNSATTYKAFGWQPISSHTLGGAYFYVSNVAGTLASGNITCVLEADSGQAPSGTAIETVTSTATTTGWTTCTFAGTSSLTANNVYWIVIQNANGTPGTNYPTIQSISFTSITISQYTFNSSTTTNGSTWTPSSSGEAGLRVFYNDSGTYRGYAFSGAAASSTKVESTNELGDIFQTPANASLIVNGVQMWFRAVGGPSNGLVLKLYTCTAFSGGTCTLQGSGTIPATSIATSASVPYAAFFSSVTIPPSTYVRISAAQDSGGGSTSIYYQNQYELTIDTNSASTTLLPFDGIQRSVCSGTCTTGSNWTNTNTAVEIGGIYLANPPFPSSTSSAIPCPISQ